MANRLPRLILVAICLWSLSGSGAAQAPATRPPVIPKENPEITEVRKAVDAQIDALSARLLEINDWMYHNPESGFVEFKASAMLADELKKHGFEVEMGVPNLPSDYDRLKLIGGLAPDYSGAPGLSTAFKAKYKGKSDRPVIGFMVEYDALRGHPPFHGCQHNMQGPTGIGAAIALAETMEKFKVPGSVWVIGAPAEEVGPPPKRAQAESGYLNGIDFMMISHGTGRETLRSPAGFSSMHLRQMKYTFHGKPAHAAGDPWHGVSALDAVILMLDGIERLREHSEPQFRFHYIIDNGGVAPNIVPQLASAVVWVRHLADATNVGSVSPMKARMMIEAKREQMDNIARGAAQMTGTTVDVDRYGDYDPGVSVGTMNDIMFQYAVDYGAIRVGEAKFPGQWDETGAVTLLMPGVQAKIGTEGIPEAAGHSQENADITITPAGHVNLVQTAKVMAATALRLFMDPELARKAKDEHAALVEKYRQP
ncbi:MAG: M20 family metallopeptidase [Acidobacteria bacterium]|nr:M20 family metallopeptidase [Acidobacteriota bacterium]